jgi:hypothetical protein
LIKEIPYGSEREDPTFVSETVKALYREFQSPSPSYRIQFLLRTNDEVTWDFEAKICLGTDLREPRLLSWNGMLFLYFAVLGKDAKKFEHPPTSGNRGENGPALEFSARFGGRRQPPS